MEQTGSFLIKLFVKAEGMHRKCLGKFQFKVFFSTFVWLRRKFFTTNKWKRKAFGDGCMPVSIYTIGYFLFFQDKPT